MNWQDTGFLLSKNKYSENNSIAEFYTKNHGKVTGVIYGSTSKKIKNYLLIGNKFHLNFNSKNDSKVGYFKLEIDQVVTPLFMDDKNKLLCISYAMSLIKLLTVEDQQNENVFYLTDNLKNILNHNKWLLEFIFWELNFYKCIGYDIEFKNYVKNKTIDGDDKFVVESTKKIIPNFLINNDIYANNKTDIFNGFKIVGDFLDKSILKPNNINYPLSRTELGNLIKST